MHARDIGRLSVLGGIGQRTERSEILLTDRVNLIGQKCGLWDDVNDI